MEPIDLHLAVGSDDHQEARRHATGVAIAESNNFAADGRPLYISSSGNPLQLLGKRESCGYQPQLLDRRMMWTAAGYVWSSRIRHGPEVGATYPSALVHHDLSAERRELRRGE